jgi:hypothetical protein
VYRKYSANPELRAFVQAGLSRVGSWPHTFSTIAWKSPLLTARSTRIVAASANALMNNPDVIVVGWAGPIALRNTIQSQLRIARCT